MRRAEASISSSSPVATKASGPPTKLADHRLAGPIGGIVAELAHPRAMARLEHLNFTKN
jgi:hypothetical protein